MKKHKKRGLMNKYRLKEIAEIVGGILTEANDVDVVIERLAPPLKADENSLALALSEEEIENYATLVNTACDMYIAENPGLDNETNAPCSECLDNILSNIYTKTLQTNGELSTTVNELDDTVIVALEIDCPEKCGKKYQDDDIRLGLCIFFCGLIDIIL